MTLVIIALLTGAVIGFARGGGLARLAALRPVRNRLVLTGLGVYAGGVMLAWLWSPALAVFAGLAMLVWAFYAWLNRPIQGALLIATGFVANALVLILNGAIPVSLDAVARAGADVTEALSAELNEPADAGTTLAWLGKSVPVAFPPRPEVVSPGDLAIAAGLAVVVCLGLTERRRELPWAAQEYDLEDREPADEWVGASAPR